MEPFSSSDCQQWRSKVESAATILFILDDDAIGSVAKTIPLADE